MSEFKKLKPRYSWMTIYIYYTDNGNLYLDTDMVIIEDKGNKYKEIATGTILKLKNFDLTELKGAYQLRTDYFLDIIHDNKIIPVLDKKGIYLCVSQEGEVFDLSKKPTLDEVRNYLNSFEDGTLNYYLKKKRQEREEHDYRSIKRLVKSRNK